MSIAVWIALASIAATVIGGVVYVVAALKRKRENDVQAGRDALRADAAEKVVKAQEAMGKAGAESRDTLDDLRTGKF